MLISHFGSCCGFGHWYKGHWVEFFIGEDGNYDACVELPHQEGVVTFSGSSWDEAKVQAHVFIDKEIIPGGS